MLPFSGDVPTQYIVQGGSDSDSSGACTAPVGTDSVANGPKALVNGKASGGVNLATTWTDTDTPNPSDVTTVSGTIRSDLQGAGQPQDGQDHIEVRAKTVSGDIALSEV